MMCAKRPAEKGPFYPDVVKVMCLLGAEMWMIILNNETKLALERPGESWP